MASTGGTIADVVTTDAPSGGDDTAALQARFDEAFGSVASPHGTALCYQNRPLFIRPGHYQTTAPINLSKYLHGGKVFGAGRFSTKIINSTANSDVFRTNGCAYSSFSDFLLQATGTGRCFDLDWDGTAGGAALQSNKFDSVEFYGASVGLHIGRGTYMGSESTIINCFFLSNTTAGLLTANANALQQTVIGGNFQGCGIGIWVASGSVNIVHGVGFQLSDTYDIQIDYSAYDTMDIAGCRTESLNFVWVAAPAHVDIRTCTHLNGVNGDFVNCGPGQPVSITNCRVGKGRVITTGYSRLNVKNSMFDRQDWLSAAGLNALALDDYAGHVELEGVIWGLGAGEGPITQVFKQRRSSAGSLDYAVTSTVTELTTIAAAAFTDTTIQIPAGTRVKGVTTRVTTAIPTATTFDVGVAGATTRYATGVAVAANTTDRGMLDGNTYYGTAVSIRITPNATPGANTGRVRVTVHYETIAPPLS